MRVRDAMTERVLTIAPDRSLRDAAQFMTEQNVGAAVIIDPEQPGPGIVTERDLVRSFGSGEDPRPRADQGHLTSRATFADADWDPQEAADAMAKGGFRHLVVVQRRPGRGDHLDARHHPRVAAALSEALRRGLIGRSGIADSFAADLP